MTVIHYAPVVTSWGYPPEPGEIRCGLLNAPVYSSDEDDVTCRRCRRCLESDDRHLAHAREVSTPGEKVVWTRGQAARHAACGASTRSAAPEPIGRRTGCSCGSRESAAGDLVPSSRNCAGCEHDA